VLNLISLIKWRLKRMSNPYFVELLCKRGDRVYLIKDYWSKKENKSIKKVCTTHLIGYLIYPETPVRILYNITDDSSWHEINNLYVDRKSALEALKGTE
jgi:hypothetical protein